MEPSALPDRLPPTGFTAEQARIAGVTRARSRAKDLLAPYTGTRVVRDATFRLRERCGLVLRLVRPDAFVCGPTAAVLHGMPLPDEMAGSVDSRVDVAVPPNCRAPRIRGIRGRVLAADVDDVDRRHGFRATTPERTWCDLAAELRLPALVAAGDHLISRDRPVTTPERLAAQVTRSRGRRGHRKLVAAMPLLSDAAESPKESETRVLVVTAGLPTPEVNVDVFDERGRFVARVDLLIREFRVVIEYEGDHHRTEKAQWRSDLARVGELESLGYVVIRVTAADLTSPAGLIARIERHLRRRGWQSASSGQ
jgi:hypothetical protein